MAGPLALIIPLGVLLIGGAAVAAASKKKKDEAAPASPAAAEAAAAVQTAPPPGTPADVAGMIVAATKSGNPATMHALANALRAKYPQEAMNLDTNADQIQKVVDQWGVATLPEAVAKEEEQKRQQAAAATSQSAAQTAAAPAAIASGSSVANGAAAGAAVTPQPVMPPFVPPATPAPGAAPAPPVTTPVPTAAQAASTPIAAAQQLVVPSDVQALILTSMASNNPETMRRAADSIAAKYPQQAADLRAAASALEGAIALQQAAAVAAPAIAAPAAQAAQVLTQAAQAASQAGQPAGVPATTNVPTPTVPTAAPPQIAMPTPTAAPTPAADPNRLRAEALALKMKFAVKGKEDKATVKEFQTVERLPRTDGSYGSETATALADRYGIVPPKPLYWGKKGGDYQTLLKDKQQYSAHLLVLAQNDPQRADEWRAAAKVG
jgi:hypothetical protein